MSWDRNIDLDEHWSIRAWDTQHGTVYDVMHACWLNPKGKSLSGTIMCYNCGAPIPPEIKGFLSLCRSNIGS